MTTNRMGLEQALSDERIEQYANDKRMCNINDEIRCMARELMNYRKASKEPVAYMTYKGYLLHAADPKVAEYSEPTPLYEAPPLQAVTAPDAKLYEEVEGSSDIDYMSPSEVYELGKVDGWNSCRATMLKK